MGVKRAFSLREKYEICLEWEKQVKAGKKMRLDEFGLLFPDRSGKGIPKSTLSDILAMSDEILKNPPVDGAHKKKKRAPFVTLRKRFRGITRPRSTAHQKEQLLNTGEEDAVAEWCGRMTRISTKVVSGIHWGHRFLARHPKIKLKYCQYLEKLRAKVTATVDEQRQWYQTLRSLMHQYKIIPNNLWNWDEKGIIMSLAVGQQKTIVQAGMRSKVAFEEVRFFVAHSSE
ncbi:hypothetical protein EV426DRAFT_706803 [Tirmania nivea]|nr:hypothetical protein EV426DRAFT_706803 [Tirmania nivea]